MNLNTILWTSFNRFSNVKQDYSQTTLLIVIISFLILVGVLYYVASKHARKNKDKSLEYYDSEHKLFLLAAQLIKADENIQSSELKKVQQYFLKVFEINEAREHFTRFKSSLNKETNLDQLINDLNYNMSYTVGNSDGASIESKQHKVKWLHFLVSISVADRVLSNSELEILTTIRKGWDIHSNTLDSILAMFNYYTEEDVNRQKRVKQYKPSSLDRFYKILELKENATEEETKKAYRTLVKLYHPDKQTDKTTIEKTQAEAHFKEIQEAYEQIKKSKGYN